MAQTPEAKVKAKIVDILKDEDVYYFFPATHGYGRSGVPDIVVCYRGKFIGIECKAGKGQPTALQLKNLAQIREQGGIALVVNEDTVDGVQELMQLLKGEIT